MKGILRFWRIVALVVSSLGSYHSILEELI
jgi:hypothetical protein